MLHLSANIQVVELRQMILPRSSSSRPGRIEVRTDVTQVVGAGPTLETVATVCLPDPAKMGPRPVVAFGFPGAG